MSQLSEFKERLIVVGSGGWVSHVTIYGIDGPFEGGMGGRERGWENGK